MEMILMEVEEKMEHGLVSLKKKLGAIRTGRANPNILERVRCDYYGSLTPITQMAGVSVVEGRQLMIKPYDKSMIKQMEKAINESDLGYPVQNDGNVLRINIPPLTEDTRKQFSKEAHKIGEDLKVVIRNARRDGNDMVKKNKELTEDMKKEAQEKIQKLTDSYVKKIDEIVKDKQADIMSI